MEIREMRFKRTMSFILAVAILLGFAGCKRSYGGTAGEIGEIMDSYTSAINAFDFNGIVSLTNWNEYTREYEALEKCMDTEGIEKSSNADYIDCIKYIASEIKVEYDLGQLETDGDETSLIVNYEIVDWESVYKHKSFDTFDEVLNALKSEKKTTTVKGKVSFVQEGTGWKITKLTKMNDVFKFVSVIPNVGSDLFSTDWMDWLDWDWDWSDIDLSDWDLDSDWGVNPTFTSADDETYRRSIEAYLAYLEAHEDEIRHAEDVYSTYYCGIYDINGDLIPEMFVIEADDTDDDYSSASLYVVEYDDNVGEAVEVITVPEIVYTAEGANFIIYVTPNDLIIYHTDGEMSDHHITTDIYDFYFVNYSSFECDVSYSYDPDTDTENYSYTYYMGITGTFTPIDKTMYDMMLEFYVMSAYAVIGSNFTPTQNDNEYALNKLPNSGFISYDDMHSYLESEL
jgi:hypothetical protein